MKNYTMKITNTEMEMILNALQGMEIKYKYNGSGSDCEKQYGQAYADLCTKLYYNMVDQDMSAAKE